MTADGDKEIEAKRKSGDIVKCVVVRCYETKCVFGHVIPQKGSDEDGFTVNLITGDIGWLGHTKLILKTDQEKSLVSLVSRALLTLRVQVTDLESVTVEHSQAYDSQASGGTEVGVRAFRGLYGPYAYASRSGSARSCPSGTRCPVGCWDTRRCCSTRPSVERTALLRGGE